MAKRNKKEKVKEAPKQEPMESEEQVEVVEGAADIEQLEEKNRELQDKYLRLYSDFENYKKRVSRERLDTLMMASKDLVSAILPVLDDFERAQANAKDKDAFDQGIGLIYNKLYRTLEQEGLKAMESTGKPFDPEFHEAITKLPAPSKKMKGMVMDTVEKGYFLKDKILRYAKVVVAE